MSPDLQQFETAGYAVFPGILSDRQLQHLAQEIESFADVTTNTRKVLEAPWCSDAAEQLRAEPRLRPLLPPYAQAVQCTLFSKTRENNWLVSLHQDLSIPVAERVESLQCSGWSHKEGDLFVQPPVTTLERIVALRLHLDDCDEENGALRVVPGSHRLGRLSNSAAQQERNRSGESCVAVPRGGVMAMRPLLLHASSKASRGSPRRVLHFVYGPPDLPSGLRWPLRNRSMVNAL
jgi:ectoine hydroxylase-related dioxygenase (phytanoyl-CoA dioxygenase family)